MSSLRDRRAVKRNSDATSLEPVGVESHQLANINIACTRTLVLEIGQSQHYHEAICILWTSVWIPAGSLTALWTLHFWMFLDRVPTWLPGFTRHSAPKRKKNIRFVYKQVVYTASKSPGICRSGKLVWSSYGGWQGGTDTDFCLALLAMDNLLPQSRVSYFKKYPLHAIRKYLSLLRNQRAEEQVLFCFYCL